MNDRGHKQVGDISVLILNSPVARALGIIGDRWAHLILRDAFLGVRRFEDFRRRTGAARGTLASRLKSLVSNGILRRSVYQEAPVRHEYRLTEKGMDLYPMVLAAWDWEVRWDSQKYLPPVLTHSRCGQQTRPLFRCRECHSPIRIWDVSYRAGASESRADEIPARFQRRSRGQLGADPDVDPGFFAILNVIGDRWTGLVVASLFFGLNRYDDIAQALGIATNILSNRLKILASAGVLRRVPYQQNPARYEYRLTDKGADLYTHALQMHEWAGRWLLDDDDQPLILKHDTCGKHFHSEVVCSACGEDLDAREVTFDYSRSGEDPVIAASPTEQS